ncbi:MAG TPA: ISNCY family transposase [Prosthecobacter sp.]|nr:ISNCY family transposase [Prosthecobacter sp.]
MDELRMSVKERIRLDALGRVNRRELSVVAAAELMDLSVRQARRVWKRFKLRGHAGLVHGLRGRVGNRRLDQETRDRIIKLHQERYSDFGPTLACEKLASEHELSVSPDTLVAMLKERGLWERRRRRGRHRKRRERRSSFGSLIQMDGSHHGWFEGRSARCVLMVLIDDATGRTYARLYDQETTEAAFDAFGRWVKAHGVPRALYVDRDSIYQNAEDMEKLTQFGRAMKELGVELICAHSPQAKGRVERRHAVFQDRLVKELRLRSIRDMKQANDLLEHGFLKDLNRRFAVKAARSVDLHRTLEKDLVLEEVLCVQEQRMVGRDWCVRWRNQWLQIEKEHAALKLAQKHVLVKELAAGELIVEHQGKKLKVTMLSAPPQAAKKPRKPAVNNVRYKPAADHPWNRDAVGKAVAGVRPFRV